MCTIILSSTCACPGTAGCAVLNVLTLKFPYFKNSYMLQMPVSINHFREILLLWIPLGGHLAIGIQPPWWQIYHQSWWTAHWKSESLSEDNKAGFSPPHWVSPSKEESYFEHISSGITKKNICWKGNQVLDRRCRHSLILLSPPGSSRDFHVCVR